MSKNGLAFSGGGIRSAAFCSGVLRRLLQRGVEPDYLSCVSGGGYTGTAYVEWKYRHEQQDDPSWHKRFFEHMRIRAGLLCDWQRPLLGIIDTVIIVALFLYVSVITPLVMWGSYTLSLAYAIDYLFGDILRADRVRCDDNAQNSTNTQLSNDGSCIVKSGTKAFERVLLFTATLAIAYVFRLWGNISSRFSGIAHLLSYFSGLLFAFTFGPWFINDFLRHTARIAPAAIAVVAILTWAVSPRFRSKAAIAIIIFSNCYAVYWRVFRKTVLGIEYNRERFLRLLFASGLVMCFAPAFQSLQARVVNIYTRWRLQKSFYTEQSVGACGWGGLAWYDYFPGSHLCLPKKTDKRLRPYDYDGPLRLADMQGMKPQYISNIVVNQWRDDHEDPTRYDLLAMSPTEIERITSQSQEVGEFSGKVAPEDVKLSYAMTASAAALSRHAGAFDESMEPFKNVLTMLGLGVDAAMVSDPAYEQREGCLLKVLPYIIELARIAPLVIMPPLYFSGVGGRSLVPISILVFFAFMVLLTAMSIVNTGIENPGCFERMARWLIVHEPFCQFIRDLLGVIDTGPVPPAILRLSDGGHIENLALLPLLKRRLQRIVVVNGGQAVPDSSYATDVVIALQLAREKLRCYFTGENGRDVLQDIEDKFVKKPPGKQPRSYKFRVDYYERADGSDEDQKVGEGEILLIAPRHPDKGIATKERVTWKEALRDIDVDLEAKLWGPGPDLEAAEVDRLTFCCCECCHDKPCCGIAESLCGTFPQQSTGNQFFTPTQFSAYHREGYRACVEAEAAKFLGAASAVEMRVREGTYGASHETRILVEP